MDGSKAIDCLQFQYHPAFDDQIQSMLTDDHALVPDSVLAFLLDSEFEAAKLGRHRLLVDTLKKSWPKRLVNGEGGADDPLCQRIIGR